MRSTLIGFLAMPLVLSAALERLEVMRQETVLGGKEFGLAGAYRKVIGKAHFVLDPGSMANQGVVDLGLAPRDEGGKVRFSADFYLLTPMDPARSNGKLFYEAPNRGTKSALRVFQHAVADADPVTEEHYGDGLLMKQGYSILWMGWQWDVPAGRMSMELPIGRLDDKPITGQVRSNFILYQRSLTADLGDRGHKMYEPVDLEDPEATLTIREGATEAAQKLPRGQWRMLPGGQVTIEGGFAPGRIYEVIYTARDPRVLGCSLAATRDLISWFKQGQSGFPGIRQAIGWGLSQSGRFLRHFVYEGFNEGEGGGRVFDGILDEVSGAGRGAFNERFGQASRDAEQHFNFFYPVDVFPFADRATTDPGSGQTDSLLRRAEERKVTPKLIHVLSSSEYYNRGGSLIHTDPAGKRDVEPASTSRIYLLSSTPHFAGGFPPQRQGGARPETQQALNPLSRTPVMRALLMALDKWVSEGKEPPPSRYPKIVDQTLTAPGSASWPSMLNLKLPPPALRIYRLDFSKQPPTIGAEYPVLVPAPDGDGHDRAGIRLPQIAVPVATYTGWNYRHPETGAAGQLAGETGSVIPFARTRAERNVVTDSRLSLGERYPSREHYLGLYSEAARRLIGEGFLLAEDLAGLLEAGAMLYDQFTRP